MGAIKPLYLYIALTLINISVFSGYVLIPKASDYQQQKAQQKITQDFLR